MTNNDILRRIRYPLDLGDARMMAIFALADLQASRAQDVIICHSEIFPNKDCDAGESIISAFRVKSGILPSVAGAYPSHVNQRKSV